MGFNFFQHVFLKVKKISFLKLKYHYSRSTFLHHLVCYKKERNRKWLWHPTGSHPCLSETYVCIILSFWVFKLLLHHRFQKGDKIRRQAQSPLYNHIRPGSLWISAVRALSTPVASKPSSAQYWGCSVPLVHLSQWESKRWQWNIHSDNEAGYIKVLLNFAQVGSG